MLKKIIEYFYPSKNKKEESSYDENKFLLKHEGTWYSEKFRNVFYSTNGGKTWIKIKESNPPLFTHSDNILEYNWSFKNLTFNIEDESFSNIRKQFDSLKTIEDFMNREYARYLRGLEEVKQQRKEYRERIERNSK